MESLLPKSPSLPSTTHYLPLWCPQRDGLGLPAKPPEMGWNLKDQRYCFRTTVHMQLTSRPHILVLVLSLSLSLSLVSGSGSGSGSGSVLGVACHDHLLPPPTKGWGSTGPSGAIGCTGMLGDGPHNPSLETTSSLLPDPRVPTAPVPFSPPLYGIGRTGMSLVEEIGQ